MKKKKLIIFFGIFLLIAIFFDTGVSAYLSSNYDYSQGYSTLGGGKWVVDRSMCEAGQDFIVQIAPSGCEPAVVRSDLLEEQNVPVFCQLAATQINPMIEVDAIESISFSGEYPEEIQGIGFHPAKSALGTNGDLNSAVLENIGYVVIVLKQNKDESSMPDFVSGNLTATLEYDFETSLGIGEATFYLPQLEDSEWEQKKSQYSFWKGKGYLRANGIGTDGATISLYSGTGNLVSNFNLGEGEISDEVYISGFDCLAGVKIRLESLEAPDTRAKLEINGEIFEVSEGEEFLEGRCKILDLNKDGTIEKVKIKCREDDAGFFGGKSFELISSPKIRISVGDDEMIKEVGDYLYTTGDKRVYLGYVDTFEGTEKEADLYGLLIAIPASESKERLTDSEISILTKYNEGIASNQDIGSVNDFGEAFIDTYKGLVIQGFKWAIKGEDIGFISIGEEKEFGEKVELRGFVKSDSNLLDDIENYYESAFEDYDTLLGSFSSVAYQDKLDEITMGEQAFYEKIMLASKLEQKKTVSELCELFQEKYPGSDKLEELNEECEGKESFLNSEISTRDVLINSNVRSIALRGIYEPDKEDYNAKIDIKGTNGITIEKVLAKGEVYYLDTLRDSKELVYVAPKEESLKATSTFFSSEELYLLEFYFDSEENRWLWSIDNGETKSETSTNEVPDLKAELCDEHTALLEEMNNLEKRVIDENVFSSGRSLLMNNDFEPSTGIEYVRLIELDDGSAELEFNLYPKGFFNALKKVTISNEKGTLKEDTPESFGSDFIFTLREVEFEKEAKVRVIPSINNVDSKSNFSFKIGIEKRAIQLSPEQTKEKIKNLQETIAEWEKISESLGSVVKGLKGACLATEAYLVVKNFLFNTDGKAIARKSVMRMEGGWNDKCSELVKNGVYETLDECFAKEADNIDSDVEEYYEELNRQNEEIKEMQEDYETTSTLKGLLGEKQVDTDEFKKEYFESVKEELNTLIGDREIEVNGQSISASEIISMIDTDTATLEKVRSLQLNSRISSDITLSQVDKDLEEIYVNAKDISERKNFIEGINENTGLNNVGFEYGRDKDSQEKIYTGGTATNFGDIKGENVPVIGFGYAGKEYLLELKEYKKGEYSVEAVYTLEGSKVENSEELAQEINKDFSFKKYDTETYKNEYKNSVYDSKKPVLRYYETEPYAEMPALVPFDLDNGWYASIKQTIPIMGNLESYEDSGRVVNFYVCNVGENGKEEDREGDDICQMINTGTGQSYSDFAGLKDSDAKKIIECAVKAIEQASKQYGNKKVKISTSCDSFTIEVGEPAIEVPELQCQDFMSPADCKLLFNVCDPVICPSSRCNFGGTYHVEDVIQSGIVGSILLCLPNIREGIYIPVCLTGIKAGIDGYISVMKSYRDCLNDSLNEGELVGICDEINSIYICEFFWEQALPLTKIAIPKLTELIMGQNVQGGGEYLGVESAWESAEESVSYFTQYYAANSYEAFKQRSTEELGGEICNNYVSGVYSEDGNVFDALTEPDSPPQYYGNFEEISLTTATNPPISQYKVYYHIYAGEDSRAYYKVYLKGDSESSFYEDASSDRLVASGYISKGDYASETKDFTASSGYKKLCIVVNGEEECGFGQVTTSLAIDYVTDKYLEEQATAEDITTESECISGSASLYSILNPNIQSAAEEILNPAIYNKGIIRVCATKNPGTGTDSGADSEEERWVDVGYCDDEDIRCWIDMESVSEVIENLEVENDTLNTLTDYSLKALMAEGDYLGETEFDELIEELGEQSSEERIETIEEIFKNIFFDNQKARLLLIRGYAYGELAVKGYRSQDIEDIDEGGGNGENEEDSGSSGSNETEKESGESGRVSFSFGYDKEEYENTKDNHFSSTKEKEEEYESYIKSAAEKFDVNFNLIRAIIKAESDWEKSATSGDSFGLMQLNPSGAIVDITSSSKGSCHNLCYEYYGDAWKTHPEINIYLGTCYLKCLHDIYKITDIELLIASYNTGPTNVNENCYGSFDECKDVLPIETQNYVPRVLNFYETYSE